MLKKAESSASAIFRRRGALFWFLGFAALMRSVTTRNSCDHPCYTDCDATAIEVDPGR
jgi:hypothetical protein